MYLCIVQYSISVAVGLLYMYIPLGFHLYEINHQTMIIITITIGALSNISESTERTSRKNRAQIRVT